MCFKGGTWKREVVPDHKFDFVDTREFRDNSAGMRFKYMWLYIIILKDLLVYVSDIFTAVTMLSTDSWSNAIFESCPPTEENGCVYIPFNIGKWLFFGCIIFSFLLLAYEGHKAKKIIASRDISYAFTNVMANNYYSLRSYDHFCFFNHISDSTKRMDDFAFFVFFTFKSWKRLLLADGPRQSINALTLYAFILSKQSDDTDWWDIKIYFTGNSFVTTALTITTAFTVLVFAGSLLLLLIAGVCYIPLLCHIQGNLKEYCCHKVDKRITEIIKRRNKQRLAKAAALAKKEAAGDFSHLKNKKGELIAQPLRQPTLPNVSVDDDLGTASGRTKAYAPSTLSEAVTGSDYYFNDRKDYAANDYPPMPAYNQPYGHYPEYYNGSTTGLPDEHHIYDDEYGSSTAHLTSTAAPFARGDDAGSLASYQGGQGYYNHDPAAHHGTHQGAAYGQTYATDAHDGQAYTHDAQAYTHDGQAYAHDGQAYEGQAYAHHGQAYGHDSDLAYGDATPAYPGTGQPAYRTNTPMDHKGNDGHYAGHAI
ncbi:hypothetical protein BXZ70DRAFT_918290 [Cristinia sonorae]|uniref:Vacuole protein n=1 Tax=Cristinia sonorae TaxID=1940300 RepID=A0A8K0UYF2_9AGAR|nr:hypothetical protein BXZ70DRAFT_918290 [Cristinia sonorae]